MNPVLDLLFAIAICALMAAMFRRQWVFWLLLAVLVFHETNKTRGPYLGSDYEHAELYDPYSDPLYDDLYYRRR